VPASCHDVGQCDQSVDDYEHAADDRRKVEPAEVQHDAGRETTGCSNLGHLPAVDGHERAEGDDQETLACDDGLLRSGTGNRSIRRLTAKWMPRRMPRARADEREPGQRPLADFLDPEEPDGGQIEAAEIHVTT